MKTLKYFVIFFVALSLSHADESYGQATAKIQFFADSTLTTTSNLVGDAVVVVVDGLTPHQKVRLTAKMHRGNRVWISSALYQADAAGLIRLDSSSASSGTYSGIDADGIFWSMTPEPTGTPPPPSLAQKSANVAFSLESEAGQVIIDEVVLQRLAATKGVTEVAVTDNGLVGTLFLPAGRGPHPVVMLFGGSEGGTSFDDRGRMLASKGFAALSLGYFGLPGLPPVLMNIPLEYFKTAIDWLKLRPDIDSTRLATMGVSRGGELSLLLGSLFSEIKAVIAWAPSSLAWDGCCTPETEKQASWTFGGKVIPYLDLVDIAPDYVDSGQGRRMVIYSMATMKAFATLADNELEPFVIPVEKIQGPILMIGGQDDLLWPSCTFMEIASKRLLRHRHEVLSLCFPNAGHSISALPGLPTSTVFSSEIAGTSDWLARGGTPQGASRAHRQAWNQVMIFLKKNLKP